MWSFPNLKYAPLLFFVKVAERGNLDAEAGAVRVGGWWCRSWIFTNPAVTCDNFRLGGQEEMMIVSVCCSISSWKRIQSLAEGTALRCETINGAPLLACSSSGILVHVVTVHRSHIGEYDLLRPNMKQPSRESRGMYLIWYLA